MIKGYRPYLKILSLNINIDIRALALSVTK